MKKKAFTAHITEERDALLKEIEKKDEIIRGQDKRIFDFSSLEIFYKIYQNSFYELQDKVKRLTAELAETKEQRDRIAKDFDRLKTIVDAGYRESADTTCTCRKVIEQESGDTGEIGRLWAAECNSLQAKVRDLECKVSSLEEEKRILKKEKEKIALLTNSLNAVLGHNAHLADALNRSEKDLCEMETHLQEFCIGVR